ncbi:hypothetical protein [Cysteiniphilum sp. 6C5]|uniref:hypothetical protein n=1 Tax=unclassified Cysteiniphilum TaxID=2610889 RepID=UPI003F85C65A
MRNLKTNWQTLTNLIENKTTVFVKDKRGYTCQGIITMADHRSMWIKLSDNDKQNGVWLNDVVEFREV